MNASILPLFAIWLSPDTFSPLYNQMLGLIEDLAGRYDGPIFGPHATLLAFHATDAEAAREQVHTLASKLKPFDVVLEKRDGCVRHDAWNQDVLQYVERSEELEAAHRMARQHMNMSDGTMWAPPSHTPHLSLLYGNHNEQLQKNAISHVQSSHSWLFGAGWHVNCLHLWIVDPPTLDAVPNWVYVDSFGIPPAEEDPASDEDIEVLSHAVFA
eukprot:TRINITY_DN56469_c0_g1_i1.p1 TRINITY_DN56469_c0_g1~~TRINITY_DN56469_c0_g1_i1.p1  ORF type:complete len:213 (-),score=34.08 TRINITY_DN56469_c0_g1_i1:138-776(-)